MKLKCVDCQYEWEESLPYSIDDQQCPKCQSYSIQVVKIVEKLKCNMSWSRAKKMNLPQYCAFNEEGVCIVCEFEGEIAVGMQEQVYSLVGLIVPMCLCFVPCPVREKPTEESRAFWKKRSKEFMELRSEEAKDFSAEVEIKRFEFPDEL